MILTHFNYVIVMLIVCLGLWAMLAKKNLIKKCIGMAIFQTGIILFFISMGAKAGSTIPILVYHHGEKIKKTIDATQYANPLTQILMLTAIVVGVATLGVALSLIQRVYSEHQSIEEEELLHGD